MNCELQFPLWLPTLSFIFSFNKLHLFITGVRLPSGSRTVFHYFVSIETGKFVVWDELVSSTKSLIEKGVSHMSLGEQMGLTSQTSNNAVMDETEMVPTVDTVRYSFLISLLLVHKHHVLLTGK